MARYDKYDPISGGFRAPLAADYTTAANYGKVHPVWLNASGQVLLNNTGANTVAPVGVMVLTEARYAGDVVDIMTHGEITDLNTAASPFDNFAAAPVAGTEYFATTAGAINATATANFRVGFTVEARRLIVRVANRAAGS